MFIKSLVLSTVVACAAATAQAANVGFFSDNGSASAGAQTATLAAGETFFALAGLGAVDLAGLDVLWVSNSDNGAQLPEIAANFAAISSFVSGGGVFIYNDRNVTDAANSLPGGGGIAFVRDLTSSIDVETGGTTLTNGAGGVINDGTLDGGNQSNHGYATTASLGTATRILNNGTPGQIVDFTYAFGNGFVHYSTIPLDFYLDGGGNNGDSFRDIYAVNLVDYGAELAGGPSRIPVPAALPLLAGALAGLAMLRRRAGAAA